MRNLFAGKHFCFDIPANAKKISFFITQNGERAGFPPKIGGQLGWG